MRLTAFCDESHNDTGMDSWHEGAKPRVIPKRQHSNSASPHYGPHHPKASTAPAVPDSELPGYFSFFRRLISLALRPLALYNVCVGQGRGVSAHVRAQAADQNRSLKTRVALLAGTVFGTFLRLTTAQAVQIPAHGTHGSWRHESEKANNRRKRCHRLCGRAFSDRLYRLNRLLQLFQLHV